MIKMGIQQTFHLDEHVMTTDVCEKLKESGHIQSQSDTNETVGTVTYRKSRNMNSRNKKGSTKYER